MLKDVSVLYCLMTFQVALS